MDFTKRYAEAYALAKTTTYAGNSIRYIGLAVAGVIALMGVMLIDTLGGSVALLALLGAIQVGLGFYLMGLMLSAQGEVLRATLDTAVNTSPLLSKEAAVQIFEPHEDSTEAAAAASAPTRPQYPLGTNISCWNCGKKNDALQENCASCYSPLHKEPEA